VPVFVRDVAKVSVGNVPRLGKAGRDHEDDVVAAIVIMNRTLHTNDVVARVRRRSQKINSDGSLPPGVKLVPFYDRTTLVGVTTSTVLHNLIFGCLLIFLIQWIFLGDLRSAIIVGANIPFALFFSIIILVLRGEDANLLSVGAVDFGIIVDAAVILVENIYRNFQARPEERQALLGQLAEEKWGADPTRTGISRIRGHGTTGCGSFWPAACRSTRRYSSPPRSSWRPSSRCSPCRGSKARSSARWREPTPMRWWER
jgi:cobalt-zinc-cadmium resistance protein CzcA